MNVRIAVICVTVLVLSLRAQGRPDVGRPSKDTLPAREKKTGRFSRLLYQTISVTPRDKEAEMRAAKADQEYFEQFAGKKIGDIRIVRENVFNPHSKVWGERKTNAMHRITQESKIRRDLFIKPGDRFDPLLVTNNRQLIRSRSYIADANIRVIPATPDSSVVDLIVTTRDRWTIGIDLNSQSDGNTYFELYDDNILGWGNKLSVKTYFNWKNWSYGGNLFEYENPNILGSFVESSPAKDSTTPTMELNSKKSSSDRRTTRSEDTATTAGNRSTSTRWIRRSTPPWPNGAYGAVNPFT